MQAIIIQILDDSKDVTTKEGFFWLKENILSESVQIQRGTKQFGQDRLQDIFALIQQGVEITKGILYQTMASSLIS